MMEHEKEEEEDVSGDEGSNRLNKKLHSLFFPFSW